MRSCSSRQLAAALVRLGCYYEKSGKGSHRTFRRQLTDGTILRAPIVLGKGEVKRGTARSILRLLQISEADFDRALR